LRSDRSGSTDLLNQLILGLPTDIDLSLDKTTFLMAEGYMDCKPAYIVVGVIHERMPIGYIAFHSVDLMNILDPRLQSNPLKIREFLIGRPSARFSAASKFLFN
jgi:hypothetical protein